VAHQENGQVYEGKGSGFGAWHITEVQPLTWRAVATGPVISAAEAPGSPSLVLGAADFPIEAWINLSASLSDAAIVGKWAGNGPTCLEVAGMTWVHLFLTRSGMS
jgi:hypothetical protein